MKSSKTFGTLFLAFACVTFTLSPAVRAQAQTVTYLGHFDGVNGKSPSGPVIQASDGNFYGTTVYGGVNAQGNVFRMTPSGKITSIYSFCSKANCADGQSPTAGPVLGKDGNLYGVTYSGGITNSGTIYKVTLNGKLTTLYTFNCGSTCANGNTPTGISLGSDGNFYGTTTWGGAYIYGVLYKITPAGKFTLLHSFCSSPNCTDGGIPIFPPHQGTDGNFYGGTNSGGTGGVGVVYKLTLSGTFTVLKNFCEPSATCNTGFYPTTVVQDANRNLFGTASNNGSYNSGTVFEITSANKFKVLHTFNYNGGQAPTKGLTLAADGNFYGVGVNDDDFASTAGFGTIFKVTPQGTFSTVHTFENNPNGPLYQAADGNLYGVTGGDGSTDFGSVYRLTLPGKDLSEASSGQAIQSLP